jgi:hypothetical protein
MFVFKITIEEKEIIELPDEALPKNNDIVLGLKNVYNNFILSGVQNFVLNDVC